MPDLPAGTVTFLFTDVEGSTRLLHELGDSYADVLAEHRRALRDAFDRHGGVEVDTQGDAFFVAFGKASDALAAAAEARDALTDGPIRVRIGLHTGEPAVTEEGYVGIDVHRAARIAAAGHGGQILVSQSTRDLAHSDALRDLGEHRLKDLTAAERIYQFGDGDFPPLKSLNRTNLPITASALIGREKELSELKVLLCGSTRLVTITGPGGAGKTRLALQVAAELVESFRDGVFWIPLASLRDSALVPDAIAQSLGLLEDTGSPATRVGEYVRDRELLLLLDNAEHLPQLALTLTTLLSSATKVRALVTSRSPLHLSLEREFVLEPLRRADAVELFITRARGVRRDLEVDETIEEICRRLEGLPLALELAAARVKMLSPRAILERLDRRLPLLTGGPRDVSERQQTLKATIDWSYELLDEREQRLFRHFAVFVGGTSIDSAEAVCGTHLEDLASLVDRSLLKAIGDDRFVMLETIREYAFDQLEECGELDAHEEIHARWYLELAERVGFELWRTGHAQWLERLEADRGNLRAALSRFLAREEFEAAARMAGALWLFWTLTGSISEGRRVLIDVLSHERELPPELLAPVLHGAGHLSWIHGGLDEARALVERAVDVFRNLGEREKLAWAILSLGAIDGVQGNRERAKTTSAEAISLFREVGSERGVAYGLNDLGIMAIEEQELDRAKNLLEKSERLATSVGDAYGAANARSGLADVTLERGEVEEAESLYLAALADFERIASRSGCAECLEGLAATAAGQGHADRAARLQGAAVAMREASGAQLQANFVPRYRRRLERAHSELGEERWQLAWDKGRSSTPEEATAFAFRR